jgi:hypothetical protein
VIKIKTHYTEQEWKERLKEYAEIEKGYSENFDEKIICPVCEYKYSKFLTKCPCCVENEIMNLR